MLGSPTLVSRTLDSGVAVEPVTLDHAKLNSRVTSSDEDDLLVGLISAARDHAEAFTRRQLVTATWEWKLPRFPRRQVVELPKAPLISVASVKYYDGSNVLQTLDSSVYRVHAYAGEKAEPGKLELAYGEVYPTTYAREDAVVIRFDCGYGATAAAVPAGIRTAILLYVEEMFRNRGQATRGTIVVPNVMSAESLLLPYRVYYAEAA
jgi:uncharacterized phiE125 gp8 family phage protein